MEPPSPILVSSVEVGLQGINGVSGVQDDSCGVCGSAGDVPTSLVFGGQQMQT
jgi:hypothetical protein